MAFIYGNNKLKISIKIANYVDRKKCKSLVDFNRTTYKYNTKNKELVLVTKGKEIWEKI